MKITFRYGSFWTILRAENAHNNTGAAFLGVYEMMMLNNETHYTLYTISQKLYLACFSVVKVKWMLSIQMQSTGNSLRLSFTSPFTGRRS